MVSGPIGGGMTINRDLWLKAVTDVKAPLADDPDAVTTNEFATIYQCGYSTARNRLKALLAAGKVEPVTKWTTDGAGRRLRVPAWRLVKTKPKK